jgi:PAS domain S-box-containing protein
MADRPTTLSTEHKHSPTIQHAGGDLYRLLVDRVQDYAIFALDPSGRIVTWNTGAERLKGYTPEEAIGKHFSMFYTAEELAAGKPAWMLAEATRNGHVEDEGWRRRKDGTVFWASVVITALRDDDGVLIGFAKVTRDLSDRRIAEQRLRESEERFRLLVESVRDYAIFMLDPTGHVATWNIGAQRIKGYTAEEIIGRHFSIFYPAEDVAAGKTERELEIATRTGEYVEEGWRIRKDGSRFWARVVITAIRTTDGTLAGFAKVTRDLRERRSIEELTRRSEEAEANNRMKSEFLAAMSHELRTPLNAIGGYAQLLQMGLSGPITEGQAEQLARIQHSQEHLLGIINDILNFSRIEAGQVQYDIGPVVIRDVMTDVAPMLEPQLHAKGIRLTVAPCPEDVVVVADRSKVEQILINLLSNAAKFTPSGGRIDLECEVAEETVTVSLRDTGIGIPEDKLEVIFAPFVQVGRGLATPKEGTGLGLAISRDLARAMGGDLTVESTLGMGSTFSMTLRRVGHEG